ncbi:hypothetical protein F3Y22_tig00110387pilonHSYRG00869 [Hibiscus syriacus]|uniref:Uncharacterized protein n=1 Tax=Hibiscus syriacus TaxID=106335 RepID=A0A6A3ATJ6_HIBSY|nr:hypothetical protein F3Y22_tig00110387pilonHSYRG00869 [Hibiscus syriacus]
MRNCRTSNQNASNRLLKYKKTERGTLGKAIYTVGFWIREPAKPSIALVVVSKAATTSKNNVVEASDADERVRQSPAVDRDVFVAPSASIIGDVEVRTRFFYLVWMLLRGDVITSALDLGQISKITPLIVGMGATLLDGVYVEKHAMVAAGALLRQNTRIPCGEVCGRFVDI